MTTRVWANGVKATAIADIKADLAGFISFNANGEKVLDTEAMRTYLIAQFQLISTNAEYVSPADASSSLSAAQQAPVQSLVDTLNATINVTHWSGRTDWPTTASALTGGSIVSAVQAAIADCAQKQAVVTAHFADVSNDLSNIVTQFYYAEGIDSVVPAGVTIQNTTRVAFYTYVTDKDEESAPSPASALVTMDQNDTATYTAVTPPADRFINRIRWYRGQSTNQGASNGFVAEVDAATLTYVDSKKDEELQEPCPTLTWIEPPVDLQGLVAGPNGAHAGFTGNRFCPSENNIPYAFPEEYKKTTAWPIVGVGLFDSTYVVLTRGKPYYMTGADSSALDSQPIDSMQPCVSRRSIVSGEGGVFYASAEGLCRANASGVAVVTGPGYLNLFDHDSWQALVPSSIFAAEHNGTYLFHYDNGTTAGCYALDLKTGKLVTIDATGSAFYRDLITGTLYLATGNTITALFKGNSKRTATWKSKVDIEPAPRNFAWAQVDSDFEGNLTVKLWRDGVLTDTRTITSRRPVRLASLRGIEHVFEVSGAAKATSLTLASTADELKQL